MLIANQKFRENIAEYLLYMWQLEEMIRSLQFDIELIQENIINVMTSNEDAQADVRDWYLSIIQEMKNHDLIEKGHLPRVEEIQEEVYFLHNTLLTGLQDSKYQALFSTAYPFIEELRTKSDKQLNDIEICLTALYGKLVLKMQKVKISSETEIGFTAFAKVLAYLSIKYKDFRSGKLRFQINN